MANPSSKIAIPKRTPKVESIDPNNTEDNVPTHSLLEPTTQPPHPLHPAAHQTSIEHNSEIDVEVNHPHPHTHPNGPSHTQGGVMLLPKELIPKEGELHLHHVAHENRIPQNQPQQTFSVQSLHHHSKKSEESIPIKPLIPTSPAEHPHKTVDLPKTPNTQQTATHLEVDELPNVPKRPTRPVPPRPSSPLPGSNSNEIVRPPSPVPGDKLVTHTSTGSIEKISTASSGDKPATPARPARPKHEKSINQS